MILYRIALTRLHFPAGLSRLHSTMSVAQPPWNLPQRRSEDPVLKVYNSLTRTKTEFIPRNDRLVKWYNCGPTVYEHSHMGHARNYVTQDIIRRIMTDYFGYDVQFVMNITDIDDKIIQHSRQSFLLDKFVSETSMHPKEVVAQVQVAWNAYLMANLVKFLPEEERPSVGDEEKVWKRIVERTGDDGWRAECLKSEAKFDMYYKSAAGTYTSLREIEDIVKSDAATRDDALKLIEKSHDVLKFHLDSRFGHTVTDPSVSLSHATRYEASFFKDMARLRVRRPDVLTRVTEFVPEIVSFIAGIMKKGYAYEVEGSVYFDTEAFDGNDGHHYAKLEPWSKGNRSLLQEGEGALTLGRGRRSLSDFALWKASKPGEPSWPSPWGAGRPGWHIECSVMASAFFGDNMDIHSGGSDLAFPHHDNEMAQAEAYHGCNAWVNYFLHTGHLHIEGLKMSKSLKNFITIDEILQRYTARQLRLAFLTQLWSAKVDFSESLMIGDVRNTEITFNNFFTNVKAIIGRASSTASDRQHNYETDEIELTKRVHESQVAFRVALCDSFNTPQALDVLRELVSRANIYMNSKGASVNVAIIEYTARWVGKMLRMFGLGEGENEEIGWGQETNGKQSVNSEEAFMPYLRVLSSFRDGVRRLAMEGGALKDILALCDKLRDSDLVPLGVALDDQEDGQALVKLVPPEELIKAREEKQAQAQLKAANKAAAAETERQRQMQKLEKAKIAPEEMFKPPHVPEGTYGSWNEAGLPLTNGEGKELSKSQAKKAQKEWTAQKRLHDDFLAQDRGKA